MKKVFIASTYLHIIDSIIISKMYNDKFTLFFIGQNNDFVTFCNKFFDIHLFTENKSSLKSKINQRIKNSKKMIELIQKINPNEIIVGNDRKIETSILIENYKNNYSYMDDGLHSYIPEKQHIFKYTIFEKYLKILLYKNKLKIPKFIGCNLDKAYLYKPEFGLKCYKEKIKLNIDLLNKNDFNGYLDNIKLDFNKLILFPHPKFINKQFLDKVKKIIDKNTAIKLHPRDKNKYFDSNILPNNPLEILLLKMNKNITIYGDNSTAILIAKWLGFEVYSFSKNKFFEKNGVKLWS